MTEFSHTALPTIRPIAVSARFYSDAVAEWRNKNLIVPRVVKRRIQSILFALTPERISMEKEMKLSTETYNYGEFEPHNEEFLDFAMKSPKVTMRAPSFPLEDLETGATVEMKELWKTGIAVLEFGSFT